MTSDQHWNGHLPQTDYPWVGEETVIAHTVVGVRALEGTCGHEGSDNDVS